MRWCTGLPCICCRDEAQRDVLRELGLIFSTSTWLRRTVSFTVSSRSATRLPSATSPTTRASLLTSSSSLVPSISTVLSWNAASASSGFSLRSAGRRSTSTFSSRKVTVSSTGCSSTLVVTRTPPLRHLALADREFLLDLLHRLALLLRRALACAGLKSLHDGGSPLGLVLRRPRRDQALAAVDRLGVVASIILAEATLDDFGYELVLVARQDLDVLVLEAGLEQLVDELLSDLGALDGGDHCCWHEILSCVRCGKLLLTWSSGRQPAGTIDCLGDVAEGRDAGQTKLPSLE